MIFLHSFKETMEVPDAVEASLRPLEYSVIIQACYESLASNTPPQATTHNNNIISMLLPLPLLSFVVENCHYLPTSGPFLAPENPTHISH